MGLYNADGGLHRLDTLMEEISSEPIHFERYVKQPPQKDEGVRVKKKMKHTLPPDHITGLDLRSNFENR